jgi:hypothetical protein
VLFVHIQSTLKSIMILGVRVRNLYRFREQPMNEVANMSREIDEKEKVAPLVVR